MDIEALKGAIVAEARIGAYGARITFADGRQLRFTITAPGPDGEMSMLDVRLEPAEEEARAGR
jgi:hypothetical protein